MTPARIRRAIATLAAFLVPLGLLHAFILAEICIGITDALFILDAIRARNLKPFRQPWFLAALLWWAWLLSCSTPFTGAAGWLASFANAFVILRFLVFTLALQTWLLTTLRTRRAAWGLLACSCLWIGVESWQQLLTGTNIFGNPRWPDGALTGPFWKPRAGALFGHLLFIAAPPAAIALISRRHQLARLAGEAILVLGLITAVLIGQRMGTAFAILGDLACAVFFPPLRRAAAAAFLIAGLVVLATPIISPPTHAKLVTETATNAAHFAASPYGQLYIRAVIMGLDSPWHGWGYNGFRAFCTRPQFSAGLPALGLPPTQLVLGACNLHPHNFYLQALVDAGFPGLALFSILNAFWLATAYRRLRANPTPIQIALFIGALTYIWPIASMDEFPTLYEPGWLFFILGAALTAAPPPAPAMPAPASSAGNRPGPAHASSCTPPPPPAPSGSRPSAPPPATNPAPASPPPSA